MSETNTQGGFCKTICWLIGIGAGGYLGYALVTDFGIEMMQASVFGIVAMLLVSLLFRKMLCGRGGNKVQSRQDELRSTQQAVEVQSEAEANAVMASAAASVGEPASLESAVPTSSEISAEIDSRLNAVADEIAVPRSVPSMSSAKPSRKKSSGKSSTARGSSMKPLKVTPETNEITMADEAPVALETLGGSTDSGIETHGNSTPSAETSTKSKKSKYTSKRRVGSSKTTGGKSVTQSDALGEDAKSAISAMKDAASPLSSIVEAAEKMKPSKEAAPEVVAEAPVSSPTPEATAEPAKIKPMEPKGLDQPENDTPDDLAQLSGIKETQIDALHKAGIYHFSQFVGMNRRELAWVDENISGEDDPAPAGEWRKQAIQIGRKAS